MSLYFVTLHPSVYIHQIVSTSLHSLVFIHQLTPTPPFHQALQHHPSLPSDLTYSLGVNHLAPPGTAVYKVFLAQLREASWRAHFLAPICKALCSHDRSVPLYYLPLSITHSYNTFLCFTSSLSLSQTNPAAYLDAMAAPNTKALPWGPLGSAGTLQHWHSLLAGPHGTPQGGTLCRVTASGGN